MYCEYILWRRKKLVQLIATDVMLIWWALIKTSLHTLSSVFHSRWTFLYIKTPSNLMNMLFGKVVMFMHSNIFILFYCIAKLQIWFCSKWKPCNLISNHQYSAQSENVKNIWQVTTCFSSTSALMSRWGVAWKCAQWMSCLFLKCGDWLRGIDSFWAWQVKLQIWR